MYIYSRSELYLRQSAQFYVSTPAPRVLEIVCPDLGKCGSRLINFEHTNTIPTHAAMMSPIMFYVFVSEQCARCSLIGFSFFVLDGTVGGVNVNHIMNGAKSYNIVRARAAVRDLIVRAHH